MWIQVNRNESSSKLRQRISTKMFDGIIDAKYIELFDIDQSARIKWNAKIGAVNNVYYSVAMYDTTSCK